MISVRVCTDAYKWFETYPDRYTGLKKVSQMYSFVDALELSRLETGMWERIGRQSHVVGADDECYSFMIKENVEDGKSLTLFFFGDYAVTADSRFLFRLDPSLHEDPEIRDKATQSWREMAGIFTEYKE